MYIPNYFISLRSCQSASSILPSLYYYSYYAFEIEFIIFAPTPQHQAPYWRFYFNICFSLRSLYSCLKAFRPGVTNLKRMHVAYRWPHVCS